jgi:hypothetical protein
MSQAETLINALSEGEVAAYSAVSETEGHIVIGADRHITVPVGLRRIAVQYDNDVETVTFDCPRYWDEHDLSSMDIFINCQCPDGATHWYAARNIAIEDNVIHFDWTISRALTQAPGTIVFSVSAKEANEAGHETIRWSSELCKDMYVSAGLDCSTEVSV